MLTFHSKQTNTQTNKKAQNNHFYLHCLNSKAANSFADKICCFFK